MTFDTGIEADVDAVLFDLDGTICEYRRSRQTVLDDAFERAGTDPFFTAPEFESRIPEVEGDDQFDLRVKCFAAIAEEKRYDPAVARRVADAYEQRDPTEVEFRPGAGEVLDALAAAYPLGLVTNGNADMQRSKLDALGIGDHFSASVFATPDSALKPRPEPFLDALDTIGTAPERTVYVGDSLDVDVSGANGVGLYSVWVRSDGSTPPSPSSSASPSSAPDYTAQSLRDLRSLV